MPLIGERMVEGRVRAIQGSSVRRVNKSCAERNSLCIQKSNTFSVNCEAEVDSSSSEVAVLIRRSEAVRSRVQFFLINIRPPCQGRRHQQTSVYALITLLDGLPAPPPLPKNFSRHLNCAKGGFLLDCRHASTPHK